MDEISAILENGRRAAIRTGAEVIDFLPTLLGAAILLLVGWFVARLLRAGVQRAGDHLNRLLDRAFRSGRLVDYRLSPRMLTALARIVFWLTLLVFASIAARAVGLASFGYWLDRMVGHLPNLVVGILVIVLGFLLGPVVRDLTAAAMPAAGASRSLMVGRAVQVVVAVVALIVGLDQIGINVTFIVTVLAIATAALLGGLALAFGLGARTYVANLIGARELGRVLEPGQIVRFGGGEGEVVGVTATTLVLATREGRLRIPAGRFAAESMTVVDADTPHD
ncbi:mechanosensitive ion channel family protein [Reyranella sp.]|uniref:mechanosensitive ion channel family protein n=1 Tax=Reyranella sp. TaxID=1929291 RepID=UPI003BAB95E7